MLSADLLIRNQQVFFVRIAICGIGTPAIVSGILSPYATFQKHLAQFGRVEEMGLYCQTLRHAPDETGLRVASCCCAIAEGEVPPGTNLQMLMDGRVALPTSWNEQEQLFTD